MKTFSLFSGVGGFEQGYSNLLRYDWEIIGFSEIDKYASMVLKYHYPQVKNYGNISNIDWKQVPNFDLLTGGSPCQDFSIAGNRAGIVGSRSGLVWEYIRCLREKQPRYFIWENVKGVMSSRGGWDFANILTAFSESGYSLWWQVLNAKDFGVPQNRERVFVVGVRDGHPKEVFFEPKDSRTPETMGSTKGDENTRHGERDIVYSSDGIMGSLKATDYKQPPQLMYVGGLGDKKWLDDGKQFSRNFPQGNRVYSADGIATTLAGEAGGLGAKTGLYIVAQRGRNPQNPKSRKSGLQTEQMLEVNLNGVSNALTSVEKDNYVYDGKIRKLMPIECERLMGWQDNWTKFGIDDKGNTIEISDSQRYKMCGNGVVSNVVSEIIKELL